MYVHIQYITSDGGMRVEQICNVKENKSKENKEITWRYETDMSWQENTFIFKCNTLPSKIHVYSNATHYLATHYLLICNGTKIHVHSNATH